MKNAIILHGFQDKEEYYNPTTASPSNGHWKPWLQKQLLIRDIHAQTPEVFNSWRLNYDGWAKEFERFEITPETILVGHSCGGGFLVRWLSEHPDVRVGKVVLVAPWINPDGEEQTDFFDFQIDSYLASRTSGITIFNSDNDFPSVLHSVEILRKEIEDVEYCEFYNYGHFCYDDMKTYEFPELLDKLLT